MELEKKGLQIYENFKPEDSAFSVVIIAEIDPIQYWRDNPLFIKYIEPYLKDIIEYQVKIPVGLEGTGAEFYLEQIKKIKEEYDSYEEQGTQIIEDIKKISYINDGEALNLNIPPPENLPTEIHIYDDQGNVVKTIPVDLGHREYKATDIGFKPISVFDAIPDNFSDDQLPAELDDIEIKTLQDSYIKDKLWIASNTIREKAEELNTVSEPFQDALMVIPDSTELPPEDQLQDINDKLTQRVEQWYGIPLVNLSPNETPLEDAFILQVDTRNDWTLNLMNMGAYGVNSNDIRIDKTIPPGKRFSVGVTYTYPAITLYLKIDGDEEVYTSTVNLSEQKVLKLYSIGVDPIGLKTLCGAVYDIKYWSGGVTPPGIDTRPSLPFYPSNGWIYSGQPGWFDKDKYIPVGNWTKPSWKTGDWWVTDDGWGFLHDGYVDRFFCRHNLIDTDFTITWYQYHIGYPQGIKTFVSDHIHSNYIRYDYSNQQFIIDFNGVHYTEYITLPEFIWAQMTLRYNAEEQTIEFRFRDFFHDRIEIIKLDIGPDLEFELMSMFTRFDKEDNQYVETLEGIYGFIIIHPLYRSDLELDYTYREHKLFMSKYNPRYANLDPESEFILIEEN
jgi:hypothetical protein